VDNPISYVDTNVHNTQVTRLDIGSIVWLNYEYHHSFPSPSVPAVAIA
jgi:hypothetical protein